MIPSTVTHVFFNILPWIYYKQILSIESNFGLLFIQDRNVVSFWDRLTQTQTGRQADRKTDIHRLTD